MTKRMARTMLATLAGVSCAACMLGPYDDQIVETRSAPVGFSGYDPYPGRTVELFARNPKGSAGFEKIGSARGASVGASVSHWSNDDKYYGWGTTESIPSKYWAAGGRGYYTEVMASVQTSSGTSQSMMSVEKDWNNCFLNADSAQDFMNSCSSNRTPAARLMTQDYCVKAAQGDIQQRFLTQTIEPDGSIYGVSMRLSAYVPVAKSKVKDYQLDFPEDRFDMNGWCGLYSYGDGVEVRCECKHSGCGDFANQRCEQLLAQSAKMTWQVAVKDDSVPTRCGVSYSGTITLNKSACSISFGDGGSAPDPDPSPGPQASWYCDDLYRCPTGTYASQRKKVASGDVCQPPQQASAGSTLCSPLTGTQIVNCQYPSTCPAGYHATRTLYASQCNIATVGADHNATVCVPN